MEGKSDGRDREDGRGWGKRRRGRVMGGNGRGEENG